MELPTDILEVLQKVYLKLEKQKYELDPSPLINRLVNYLYFTAYTNKIRFTEYQEELIRNYVIKVYYVRSAFSKNIKEYT
ncbi:hypothetical protein EfmJHP9_24700 [Enterococcus faecium]|nr:hypothetical protein EfmJHP9_24700 [Enterococcus faecium]